MPAQPADLTAASVRGEAAALADPERALASARFFQAHAGGYGEGDEFLGLRVPQQREIAKRHRGLGAGAIDDLLASPIHEHRLIALFCLRAEYERAIRAGGEGAGWEWVDLYTAAVRAGRVNNWDLVDSSADPILGEHLYRFADAAPLLALAADQQLWRRRVGIMGTFAYLKHGSAAAIFEVAPLVVDDRRDLIQKALGWMLREVGKRVDPDLLATYLDDHAPELGRTALSYAIEHRTPAERAHFRALR